MRLDAVIRLGGCSLSNCDLGLYILLRIGVVTVSIGSQRGPSWADLYDAIGKPVTWKAVEIGFQDCVSLGFSDSLLNTCQSCPL